jgi:hypothetical protein
MHHKYCDVMHIDEVVAHLEQMSAGRDQAAGAVRKAS